MLCHRKIEEASSKDTSEVTDNLFMQYISLETQDCNVLYSSNLKLIIISRDGEKTKIK